MSADRLRRDLVRSVLALAARRLLQIADRDELDGDAGIDAIERVRATLDTTTAVLREQQDEARSPDATRLERFARLVRRGVAPHDAAAAVRDDGDDLGPQREGER